MVGRKWKLCPPLLPDRIKNMHGVDRGDQMISLYNAGRKSMKVCCLFLPLRSLHVVLLTGMEGDAAVSVRMCHSKCFYRGRRV